MRKITVVTGLCSAALLAAGVCVAGPASADAVASLTPAQLALGRAVLPANDGWASASTGTTGGSKAANSEIFVVSTRSELVAALGGEKAATGSVPLPGETPDTTMPTANPNDTPKIIFIKGQINLNVDAGNNVLTCEQMAAGTGYSLDAYLKAYDPATWGSTTVPTGAQENARVAASAKQWNTIRLKVPANTTVIGLGTDARITGGNLWVVKSDNVIIRNIKFQDVKDCYPQWDPTDGSAGNWNSWYDSVTVETATHVWVANNSFTDQPVPDSALPTYFGRVYEMHDGFTDVTKGSDFVTIEWNDYRDHNKGNLFGSNDSQPLDPGHLKVSLHHNTFVNVLQRMPRARFGQIDVYNNYIETPEKGSSVGKFEYAVGVGKSSAMVVANNYIALGAGWTADKIVKAYGGTAISTVGNVVAIGNAAAEPVDLRAVYVAQSGVALGSDVGWTPTLRVGLVPANQVLATVVGKTGSGRLTGA